MDLPWREKANRIINELCYASWRKENVLHNGAIRRRHVPYSVPDEAQKLIECLNQNDEARAKAIFVLRAYRS